MDPIRELPAQTERVETGPVQFGDDWPGVFIRGDNAAAFAAALRGKLGGHEHEIMIEAPLKGLLETLESSDLTRR